VSFLHAIESVMLPVFDLDPVLRPASLIRPVAVFGDDPLQPHVAGRAEKVEPDLATLEWVDEDALGPACQQPFEVGLAQVKRQLAQIVATFDENIESAELNFVVVLAAVQCIEVRDASTPKYGLAVEHEPLMADLAGRLDDPRVSLGPIVTATRDQAHAFTVPLQPEAVPVALDLVEPVGADTRDRSVV
jgi:hypothetical protein